MEGQMEFAMSSALHSCRQSFMCGNNLLKVHSDCKSVANKMVRMNDFKDTQNIVIVQLLRLFKKLGAVKASVGHFISRVSSLSCVKFNG